MRIVGICVLLTTSVLLIIIGLYIGRELRKIRRLLDSGSSQLRGYLDVILSNEEEASKDRSCDTQGGETVESYPGRTLDVQLTNEEKQLLWNFDPEQLLNEVIGDIF